jgi:hypothetical protein
MNSLISLLVTRHEKLNFGQPFSPASSCILRNVHAGIQSGAKVPEPSVWVACVTLPKDHTQSLYRIYIFKISPTYTSIKKKTTSVNLYAAQMDLSRLHETFFSAVLYLLNCIFFFLLFRIVGGGGESNWVHTARRPLNGLLYLPQMIMLMENLVEWRLAWETELLGENLPQRNFVHHKTHLTRPGLEYETVKTV